MACTTATIKSIAFDLAVFCLDNGQGGESQEWPDRRPAMSCTLQLHLWYQAAFW